MCSIRIRLCTCVSEFGILKKWCVFVCVCVLMPTNSARKSMAQGEPKYAIFVFVFGVFAISV